MNLGVMGLETSLQHLFWKLITIALLLDLILPTYKFVSKDVCQRFGHFISSLRRVAKTSELLH